LDEPAPQRLGRRRKHGGKSGGRQVNRKRWSMPCSASRHPGLRTLCLAPLPPRCRRPSQQALGAEILVDIRPVDAVSATSDFPILPLLASGREQSRKPRERNRDTPAVNQIDYEPVVVELNVLDSNIRSNFSQRTHSTPLASCCVTAEPITRPAS